MPLPAPEETALAGIPWAADNDALTGFDEDRYLAMLETVATGDADCSEPLPGCLFVAVPDDARMGPGGPIVSAEGTLEPFERWYRPPSSGWRLPLALVLQSGQERLPVRWRRIAAAFVGGDTPLEARRRGRRAGRRGAQASQARRWRPSGLGQADCLYGVDRLPLRRRQRRQPMARQAPVAVPRPGGPAAAAAAQHDTPQRRRRTCNWPQRARFASCSGQCDARRDPTSPPPPGGPQPGAATPSPCARTVGTSGTV